MCLCICLLSCTKTSSNTTGDGSSPPLTTNVTPKSVDQSECSPAKLGIPDSKPVVMWKVPETCQKIGGSGMATIKSEEELKVHFDCKAPLGIDFKTQWLVVAHRMMAPAFAGNDVLDDGQKVTIVSKFRSPCPNDPHPMPAPYTLTFLLPANAERTFREGVCKVETKCP